MDLMFCELVSYRKEDEYINGLRFQLTKVQVLKFVNYFRSINKWTEYYYHEINDYVISNTDIIEILNLTCPFWVDEEVLFFFNSWSIINSIEDYKQNEKKFIFQSFYKMNDQISHFYFLSGNEMKLTVDMNLDFSCMLDKQVLDIFTSKHMKFDNDNFYYKLLKIGCQELYIQDWEGIRLDPTPGFWDEE
jgi:hypothetical protein